MFDPLINMVVQVIEGVKGPHGIDFSPDGSRVYISSEAQNVLYVVDRKSGKITNKVALVSAIDTTTLKEVARIPVGQRPKRSDALVLP
jgi:YVTN family beta-propeller protein